MTASFSDGILTVTGGDLSNRLYIGRSLEKDVVYVRSGDAPSRWCSMPNRRPSRSTCWAKVTDGNRRQRAQAHEAGDDLFSARGDAEGGLIRDTLDGGDGLDRGAWDDSDVVTRVESRVV